MYKTSFACGLSFLLLIWSSPICAQISISGKVTNAASGRAVRQASISINHKGVGTATNSQGLFTLIIPASNIKDSLKISCVGYTTQYILDKKDEGVLKTDDDIIRECYYCMRKVFLEMYYKGPVHSDLEKVIEVVNKVGHDLAVDPEWKDMIIKAPQFLRVDDFSDSAIVIKILGETRPIMQWDVAGELRKRLKIAFDNENIQIPFPQIMVNFPAETPQISEN